MLAVPNAASLSALAVAAHTTDSSAASRFSRAACPPTFHFLRQTPTLWRSVGVTAKAMGVQPYEAAVEPSASNVNHVRTAVL
jgi:hypothetical protein